MFCNTRARRGLQVIAHQCRAHLDLDERAHQVRPAAAGAVQRIERAVQRELRRLAFRETGDRHLHLRRLQAQLRHDGARGLDFLLRDPPIGLGHVAHDLEGGAKEALADLGRAWRPSHCRCPAAARCPARNRHQTDGRRRRRSPPRWGRRPSSRCTPPTAFPIHCIRCYIRNDDFRDCLPNRSHRPETPARRQGTGQLCRRR